MAGGPPAVTSDAPRSAYADAPARTEFGIRTYAVAPIVLEDGEIFGTLCALDSDVVEISDEQHAVLVELARLIARVYDDRRRREELRAALDDRNAEVARRQALQHRIATDVQEPVEALAGLAELLLQHDISGPMRERTVRMLHAHALQVQAIVAELVDVERSGPVAAAPQTAGGS